MKLENVENYDDVTEDMVKDYVERLMATNDEVSPEKEKKEETVNKEPKKETKKRSKIGKAKDWTSKKKQGIKAKRESSMLFNMVCVILGSFLVFTCWYLVIAAAVIIVPWGLKKIFG